MKLMTEITAGKNGGSSFGFSDEGQLIHDAAAAHALRRAMDVIMPEIEVHEITGLADEIMREWGFEPEAGKP